MQSIKQNEFVCLHQCSHCKKRQRDCAGTISIENCKKKGANKTVPTCAGFKTLCVCKTKHDHL